MPGKHADPASPSDLLLRPQHTHARQLHTSINSQVQQLKKTKVCYCKFNMCSSSVGPANTLMQILCSWLELTDETRRLWLLLVWFKSSVQRQYHVLPLANKLKCHAAPCSAARITVSNNDFGVYAAYLSYMLLNYRSTWLENNEEEAVVAGNMNMKNKSM